MRTHACRLLPGTSGTSAANRQNSTRLRWHRRDYSHRTTVGSACGPISASRWPATSASRTAATSRMRSGAGALRSGELDGAIVLVESEEDAKGARALPRAAA